MGSVKKFASINIRRITGGKDPTRLVEDFITKLGFDPDKCAHDKTAENVRWMISLEGGKELEVLLEGLKKPADTTVYMGVNVAYVPLRFADVMLATALEVADGLIGIKVSLVGHYLVLSSSIGMAGSSAEELEYHYRLITSQEQWFRETMANELGWEELPPG